MRQTIYPWDRWFPPNAILRRKKLNRSEAGKVNGDFQGPCHSFAQQVRNWFRKHRPQYRVSITISESSILVTPEMREV